MTWRFRREGSTQESRDLTFEQIAFGLRDGKIEPSDEVLGPSDAQWQAIENHPDLADIADEVAEPPRRVHEEPTSLDMNPLIDVCLVLLVFFILTTSYAAAVMKVIPLASVHQDKDKKGTPVITAKEAKRMINVEASKRGGKILIRIQGQSPDILAADGSIDAEKLKTAFKAHTSGADRKTEMLLEAHDIDWGTVVRIQDHAKAAGVLSVTHKIGAAPVAK
jgi:biopolymer transport protein ExbD